MHRLSAFRSASRALVSKVKPVPNMCSSPQVLPVQTGRMSSYCANLLVGAIMDVSLMGSLGEQPIGAKLSTRSLPSTPC